MGRIVHFTDGRVPSRIQAMELARRMKARGHLPLVVSHLDQSEAGALAGVETRQLTRAAELRQTVLPKPEGIRSVADAGATARWLRSARRARRASIRSREYDEVIREVDADLVIVDSEYIAACWAAIESGRPAVAVTGMFPLAELPGRPPLDSRRLPADDDAERERIAGEWDALRRRHVRRGSRVPRSVADLRALPGLATRVVPEVTREQRELAAIARARGLRYATATNRATFQPVVARGLPVMSMRTPELDFPASRAAPAPDASEYLGSIVAELGRSAEGDADGPWRAWLDAQGDGPVVYCSLGTWSGATAGLVEKVLEAAARRPDWRVIVGLGGKHDAGDFQHPPNVLLLDFAPQLAVLAVADVAIVHGGTSVAECVRTSTPMVVYSLGVNDQNGTTARAVVRGVAVEGSRQKDGPDDIVAHVEQVLGDTGQRRRVDELCAVLVAEEETALAERMLEDLMGS